MIHVRLVTPTGETVRNDFLLQAFNPLPGIVRVGDRLFAYRAHHCGALVYQETTVYALAPERPADAEPRPAPPRVSGRWIGPGGARGR